MGQDASTGAGTFVVVSRCADQARLADFRRWYRDVHIPDILATGAFEGAELLECAEGEEPRFIALYRAATDVVEAARLVRSLTPSLREQGRLIDYLDYTLGGPFELIANVTAR